MHPRGVVGRESPVGTKLGSRLSPHHEHCEARTEGSSAHDITQLEMLPEEVKARPRCSVDTGWHACQTQGRGRRGTMW